MTNNQPNHHKSIETGEIKTKTGEPVVSVSKFSQYSGPIPSADALESYEKVLKGCADRIVKMAENQSNHRIKIENKVINYDGIRSILGLLFAFMIVIGSLAACTYLILKEKTNAGLLVGMVPLGTVVGAFIYQKRTQKD
jgi:uncharacterized membrane protein